jgi:PAS domain S-box-containing protein
VRSVIVISHLLQRDAPPALGGPRAESARVAPPVSLLVLFLCTYLLAAWVGQGLAIIPGIDITFWPPAGLVIATLAVTRLTSWPFWLVAAALGEFAANAAWFGNPFAFTSLYALGNAVSAVAGASLYRWLSPLQHHLNTRRQTLNFVFVAGTAPIISATVIALVDAFLADKHGFTETWALVWLGDTTGILATAPLVFVATQYWASRRELTPGLVLEPVLVISAAVALLVAAAFTWLHLAYATLPLLVWLAMRHRFAGAAVALTFLTVTASLITSQHLGNFADPTLLKQHIVLLQSFLGIAALVSLLVAALAEQYHETLAELKEANRKLELNVNQRTERLQESEQKLQLALEAAEAGMWSIHESSQEATWDSLFADAHGLKPDAANTLESWIAAIHPQDRDRVRAQIDQLRTASTTERWQSEYRVTHPVLGERWILSIGRADNHRHSAGLKRLSGIHLDITFRKTHEERLRLLMRESSHRKKNLLAVVVAVARQTVAHTPDNFLELFQARIQGLAAGYDLLISNAWESVELNQLVRAQLAHFGDLLGTRITAEGPNVRIAETAAQPIGMALHELATNASKYGALSNDRGRIAIAWDIVPPADGGSASVFRLSWSESGGPR